MKVSQGCKAGYCNNVYVISGSCQLFVNAVFLCFVPFLIFIFCVLFVRLAELISHGHN
jgi:hypothetical protein